MAKACFLCLYYNNVLLITMIRRDVDMKPTVSMNLVLSCRLNHAVSENVEYMHRNATENKAVMTTVTTRLFASAR